MVEEEKIALSVAIITQDEAEKLPDCLRSVSFAEQIVVVDSGSTDSTVAIARDFGCDVFLEPWRGGFGAQKQYALDQCRCPWVLILDADELVPIETASVIAGIVGGGDDQPTGYSFPRKNFYQGRWIRHAGWWPDRVVRLFRRGQGRMTNAPVHEGVIVQGEVRQLDCPLEHYTEDRLSRILQKIDRYSTLGAAQAYAQGKRATACGAWGRAALTFLQTYFLRLGCLDGAPGLVLATTDAINKFSKYAKLAELSKNNA